MAQQTLPSTPTPTPTPTPATSAWTRWKLGAAVPSFLLAAAGFCGFWWMILRGLETTGCSPDCRSELYGAAFWGFPALCAVVLVGGVLATVLLRRRAWAWLVPVLGLVLVLVGFLVVNVVIDAAMLK